MSTSPTNINLNDTLPPAKPDSFNVEWQGDTPVPDPNSPGNYVRNSSACYKTPPVGGDIVLTADYELGAPDTGLTFICDSATPITIKLPSTIPQLPNPQGVWRVKIKNIGAGLVTVDPNGLNLDGVTATTTLSQGSGFEISTDNTGYWTFGNFSAPLRYQVDDLSATCNGTITNFTLSQTPKQMIGVVLKKQLHVAIPGGDFSVVGTTLTTNFTDAGGNALPPGTGEKLYALYFY